MAASFRPGRCDAHRTGRARLSLNRLHLLCVLVVESKTIKTLAPAGPRARGTAGNGRTPMFDRIARWQPDRSTAVTTRTVGALALIALAVIHVVDLPGTLGPDRLVGIGYLGIIAAAVLVGGAMIIRSGWLTWAAAGGLAVAAMAGYVLTRAVPGGFLGDHGDVGNWRCPLGIGALSVETVIILLVLLVAAGAWQARIHAASMAAQRRPTARRAPEYSQSR